MKVCEEYTIDEDVIHEKSEDSDYWKKVEEFYEDVKEKEVHDLTSKQLDWLERITEDLED